LPCGAKELSGRFLWTFAPESREYFCACVYGAGMCVSSIISKDFPNKKGLPRRKTILFMQT